MDHINMHLPVPLCLKIRRNHKLIKNGIWQESLHLTTTEADGDQSHYAVSSTRRLASLNSSFP